MNINLQGVDNLIKKIGDDYEVSITFATRDEDLLLRLSCFNKKDISRQCTAQRILSKWEIALSEVTIERAFEKLCKDIYEHLTNEEIKNEYAHQRLSS